MDSTAHKSAARGVTRQMHAYPRIVLIGVGCLTLFLRVAGAQEWVRFRGANGSGISAAASIPLQFSEKDYNWKVELPGGGHSSPVLWGKRIFLTSADEAAGKRYMLCLNA